MLLGAHVSVAGGLWRGPGRGREIDADAIQIFTRNQVQWRALPVGRREAAAFKAAVAESELRMVVAHGSYLINLASPEPATLQRSRGALLAEVRRCAALGVPLLVLHPGAHMGAGETAGIRRIVASIDHVLARAGGLEVTLLLEVTAGQGSSLGHRFEHLAEILGSVRSPERLGVCLDTCHLLAAGYDIARAKGYEQTVQELDRLVGLQKVKAVHLNDARAGLGSRVDRHAPIGAGFLGVRSFRRLVRDRRFADLPMLLETPGPSGVWRSEIALLRRAAAQK
jgi:deoxyribonuclease-4